MKLTSDLHLMPRLETSGAIPQLPHMLSRRAPEHFAFKGILTPRTLNSVGNGRIKVARVGGGVKGELHAW